MVTKVINGREIAEILILNGANLESKDYLGETALNYVCLYGKIALVQLMIGRGVNGNVNDNIGITPLMVSMREQYFFISEMLIENQVDSKYRKVRFM